jgi:hypothetical protein
MGAIRITERLIGSRSRLMIPLKDDAITQPMQVREEEIPYGNEKK